MAVRRGLMVILLLSVAPPVLANNPPAPPMFFGDILMLPIMVLFTALAGGYVIRRRLYGTSRARRIGKILAVTAAIVFAATQEGWGFLVLLIFAIMALARAIQLIFWSIRARKADRPPHLEGASSPRMAIAGTLLLVISIAFGGLAPAFIGVWFRSSEYRVAALRKFIALQMALESPRGAALKKDRDKYEERLTEIMSEENPRDPRALIERGSPGHFTIFLLPSIRRLPFFPYNYLISVPSYRGDDLGAIRMAHVHERNERCPPNAPVVFRVGASDVNDVLRGKVVPEFH